MISAIHVAVIGAGPAGLSAALWLKNLGMVPVIFEKSGAVGGMQNLNFLHNNWILGQTEATGTHIAATFHRHIVSNDIALYQHTVLTSIVQSDDHYTITYRIDGCENTFVCAAIILANGTRHVGREILLASLTSPLPCDHIIEGPYAFLNIDQLREQTVLIIGAGDNAFENALLLLNQHCQVVMVSRSEPRARPQFLNPVIQHQRFVLWKQASVAQIEACGDALSVTIDIGSRKQHAIIVNRLHILAGYHPNTDTVSDLIASGLGKTLDQDDKQFLVVDDAGRTSITHIYAAGDICNRQFPCVVSAVSSGALAAKTISRDFAQ